MLKAIQIMGSSTGFVPYRWIKPNIGRGISSISVSSAPSSSSTSRRPVAAISLIFPGISTCRSRFGAFRLYATPSESNPGGASPSSTTVQSGNTRMINFCQWCGGPTKYEVPDGEEKARAVCTVCGKIAYQNPKMVVGCLILHDNKILLCKRNIQPSFGLWTLPAGYLEIGESAAEGAIRETREEAGAEVEVMSPFAQLDIPLIGQTYIMFLAKLKKPHFSPGPESSDCQLFAIEDIPFDSLAFSSMLVTLNLYIEDMKSGRTKFHYGTINKRSAGLVQAHLTSELTRSTTICSANRSASFTICCKAEMG